MEKQLHRLKRTVLIGARPETVFQFFTDSARWAKWWGAGSSLDPHVGGRVRICQHGGVEVTGEVLELVPGQRLVFTYGYANGQPIPVNGSTVTIGLSAVEGGTELRLTHEFAEAEPRDQHIQGWRFQLSLFANVVTDEVHADSAKIADAWFGAWAEADEAARQAAFADISAPAVYFCDRFSALNGVAELTAHAGAAQKFMPGVVMRRTGEIRHCQGMVLADWLATGPDGREMMTGVNVFELNADGKIRRATGFVNSRGRT